MLARPHFSEIPAPIRKIASTFRFYGWIGFGVQLAMAFLAAIALLFAISGRAFGSDPYSATEISIFWAIGAIFLLVIGVLFDIRYIRIAKGIRHELGSHLHPHKDGVIRFLRWGVLCGFLGILCSLFGAGASVGVLVAKTVSQPPGIAITNPDKIVRAMDVFVVLSNITLIAAHLVGTAIAFWLLDRVHHYHYSRGIPE
jgi:hypothetical protein